MSGRRLLVLALSLPTMATAQTEIGRTTMFGHDLILFDDKTWEFVDPSIGTPLALTGDACFATGEGRLVFCPPDAWPERAAMFSEQGTEVFLSGGNSGHLLSVYLDESYGHAGDFGAYEDLGPAGSMLLSLVGRALGQEDYQESSVIHDGIVVVSYSSTDRLSGYTSVSLQIMTDRNSLWVDLETEFTFDGEEFGVVEHDPDLVEIVTASVLIDDIPLPRWIEAAEGKQ